MFTVLPLRHTLLRPARFVNSLRAFAKTAPKSTTPNYMLTALGFTGVTSAFVLANKRVYNDSLSQMGSPIVIAKKSDPLPDLNAGPTYDGAFNGRLNYRQVALGSTFGAILGFCISKLSSVLFVLSLAFYLTGVYLKKQGVQLVDSKTIVKNASATVDWEDLFFNQVSFSYSFLLSFLFGAML